MSSTHDFTRLLRQYTNELESALTCPDISLGFAVYDGPALGLERLIDPSPSGLALLGGRYSALRRELVEQPSTPVVTLPLCSQQLAAVQSNHPRIFIAGGERSGKTETALAIVLKRLISKPGTTIFCGTPDLKRGDAIAEKFTSKIPSTWIASHEKKTYQWCLTNGSQFRIFSARDDGEGFKGFQADAFWLDEGRLMSRAVFESALSRVPTTQSLIVSSSPEVNHWIHDIWLQKEGLDFECYHLSFAKNYHVKSPNDPDAFVKLARKFYDVNKFKRDVLGEFVASTGIEYYNFSTDRHVVRELPGNDITCLLWGSEIWLSKSPKWSARNPGAVQADPRQRWSTIVGLDLGTRYISAVMISATNHTRFELARPTFDNTSFCVTGELQETNTNLEDFVRNHLRHRCHPGSTLVICDPFTGPAKSFVDGRTVISVLERLGYAVATNNSMRSIPRQTSVDAILSLFQRERLFIHDSCTTLITNLSRFSTRGKHQAAISSDRDGHLPDAMRYALSYLVPYQDFFNHNSPLYELYVEGRVDA